MRALDLLSEMSVRGVLLSLAGDKLRVDAPLGAVTPELRAQLAVAKPDLLLELRARANAVIPIDFETRSLAKLAKVGGRRYARHGSTEALCMVAQMPDGSFLEWNHRDAPPRRLFDAIASGSRLIAHNAMKFDMHIWEMLGWPPAVWIDTAQLAMLGGLPRKLEDIAEQLLQRKKDKEGRLLTLRLSRPGKNGTLPRVTPEDMTRVVRYCRSDVELLAEIWRVSLRAFREVEADLRALDSSINERGFQFDRDLAQAIIECETVATTELFKTSGIDPATVRSPKKLIAALAQSGVTVPDIKNDTLAPLLNDPALPAPARTLIEARVASAGIASHKLRAALDRLDEDGRLRDTLNFHGAHTGRWTGQGFQPQNLPHGAKNLDVDSAVRMVLARDHAQLRSQAVALTVNVRDIAAKLVRSCVCAASGKLLAIADYSSIEPRVLAWFVGNVDRLDAFRRQEDIYKPMAAKMFRVDIKNVTKDQRNAGKPVELGCGYGMGAEPRFRTYAEGFGVDWTTMPLSPQQVVEMWRDANPLVAGVRDGGRGSRRGGLWQRLESAAVRACLGERVEVGYTVWERDGKDVVCILPSGRRMIYREALVEAIPTPWGATSDAMTYLHYEQGRLKRTKTYGGLLTENVVQAIARDVLADAMLHLDRAGFEIALSVHDEVVAEVRDVGQGKEMDAQMAAIMRTPPAWAIGLPLDVEGYTSQRYRGK
jgi:DNA polymerase